MFGRRPRYDDTFGVRLDLGADRIDPMSMRHAARPPVKETVVIERPGSIFGGSGRREIDPLASLRAKPERAAKAPARETRPQAAPRAPEAAQGQRTFEDAVLGIWQRLTMMQRISLGVFAAWFLIASGLWVVAAGIALVWFTRRKRTG